MKRKREKKKKFNSRFLGGLLKGKPKDVKEYEKLRAEVLREIRQRLKAEAEEKRIEEKRRLLESEIQLAADESFIDRPPTLSQSIRRHLRHRQSIPSMNPDYVWVER